MREITLTQGFVALVDDADFEAVNAFSWHIRRTRRRIYAVHKMPNPGGWLKPILMHRFLLPGVPLVDHKDGNGLNNQRENIRPATNQQNCRGYRRKAAGKTSCYIGVSWYPKYNKWVALASGEEKRAFLGYFEKEIDAARAYDAAAIRIYGEFAAPNFPVKVPESTTKKQKA